MYKQKLNYLAAVSLVSISLLASCKTSQSSKSSEVSADEVKSDAVSKANLPLSKLKVDPNFKIEVYAHAKGARNMAIVDAQNIFVGTADEGIVHFVYREDADKTGKTVAFADGLDNPNGVTMMGEDLVVVETTRVLLFKNAVEQAKNLLSKGTKPIYQVIKRDLPQQKLNKLRSAYFVRPFLYISIGVDCNACEYDRGTYGGIFAFHTTDIYTGRGGYTIDPETWTMAFTGLRNPGGITSNKKQKLFVTDNGRDDLGADKPGDEVNSLWTNTSYGFPYCYDKDTNDPQFGESKATCEDIKQFINPSFQLDPHAGAQNIAYYGEKKFPVAYEDSFFIAEQGNTIESKHYGYRISWIDGRSSTYRPFITGWVNEGVKASWGRPVDVKVLGGDLYVTDDMNGVIYRVTVQ